MTDETVYDLKHPVGIHLQSSWILLTLTHDIILFKDINLKKAVCKWSVKPNKLNEFSIRAVISGERRLFAIRNGKNILSWNLTDADLHSASTKNLDREFGDIQQLHTSSFFPESVIVISKNGKVVILSEYFLEKNAPYELNNSPGKDLSIIWSDCVDDMIYVLYQLTSTNKNNNQPEGPTYHLEEIKIVPFSSSASHSNRNDLFQQLVRVRSIPILSTEANHNYKIISSEYLPDISKLICFWASNDVEKEDHVFLTTHITDEISKFSDVLSFKLKVSDNIQSKYPNSPLSHSILPTRIGPSQYLVYGLQKNTTNITNPPLFSLWDAKFGGNIPFEDDDFQSSIYSSLFGNEEPEDDKFPVVLTVKGDESKQIIAIITDDKLLLKSFAFDQPKKITLLSQIIGSGESTNDYTAERLQLPANYLVLSDNATTSVRNKHFFKSLLKYVVSNENELNDDNDDDGYFNEESSKRLANYFQAVEFSTSICSSNSDEKVLSPNSPLSTQLKNFFLQRLISARQFPTLVQSIILSENYELLKLYLQYVSDIPEQQLTEITSFILFKFQPNNEFLEACGFDDDDQDAFTKCVYTFLKLIVSVTCSENFLRLSLATISLTEIKIMLEFLKQMLTDQKNLDEELLPSYSQIILWISACIDSHFSSLVHDAQNERALGKFLRAFLGHINQETILFNQISDVRPFLIDTSSEENAQFNPNSEFSLDVLDI